MRGAGIAVAIGSRGRPVTRLVVGSGSPAVIEAVIEVSGDDTGVATQLHDIAESVRSRLTGLEVERAVIRRADRPPRATNADGPRLRLLVEGAVTSASRSVVVDTRIGTGKDTGSWFGSNKAGVDAAAQQLLDAADHPPKYLEATSALLAALAIS